MLKYIPLLVILFFGINVHSQEVTVGITSNPLIENEFKKTSNKHDKRDDIQSLILPFFDDFSDSYVYPKRLLWTDSCVFVNNSYGVRPVSAGVATFDALDKRGILNTQTSYNTVTKSDYLTSQPINLNPEDEANAPFDPQSIFISFYYQPQGIGDIPEKGDSLVLEFYSPETKLWYKQWGVEGSAYSEFQYVIIQVNGALFFQDGFQFRFRNNVSLADNSRPSLVGNCDHWNIDYVYLDKGRKSSDKLFRDIAFLNVYDDILNEYTTMPWTHYLKNPKQFTKRGLRFSYRNNDNIKRLVDSLKCFVNDIDNNNELFFEGGGFNALPTESYYVSFDTAYIFPDNGKNTANFELKVRIKTDDFDYKPNNSFTLRQSFSNFYAYDDGTAEEGYGLRGEGTKNGRVAYKFTNYQTEDTLVAVQMYFNHVKNDASSNYFILAVWDAIFDSELNTYIPNNELYTQLGLKPVYPDSLNNFVTFALDSTFALPERFFIGWQKTTTEMLNVGWDKNNNSAQNLFYNISGNWEQSAMEGALMLRPVFRNGERIVAGIETPIEANLHIFPNPVENILQIERNFELNETFTAQIFDINGRLLLRKTLSATNSSLDVSQLKAGVYMLNINNGKNISLNTKVVKL